MLRQLHPNDGTDITYEGLLDMVDQEVPGPTRLIQARAASQAEPWPTFAPS